MNILVDMDGVLVSLVPSWLKRIDELYGTSTQEANINQDDLVPILQQGYGLTEEQIMKPFYEKDFWLNLPINDDAKEWFPKLTEFGEITICTKPHWDSPLCAYEKLEWLKKNFPQVDYSFIATKHKEMIRGNIIIDDMIKNLEACSAVGIGLIVYDQPWNQGYKKGLRVSSWKEVYKNVEILHEAKIYQHDLEDPLRVIC